MAKKLPEPLRNTLRWILIWGFYLTLVCGVFFLGLFLVKNNSYIQNLLKPPGKNWEVFGFAPYWKLSKLNDLDWRTLTTFAYFSLPVASDGTIDRTSYEWQVFEGKQLSDLYKKAQAHNVRRVVTLTQMDPDIVETFLGDAASWETLAIDTADILNDKGLDGVNIDFEYIPSNDYYRERFSQFMEAYCRVVGENTKDPYITVSVLASSARFNKIYDIGRLAAATDGVFMMAYDFYYSGSDTAGPSAPLYGYNNGKGPFWYDVSTAVDDFLKVADAEKIIMGVPYYGWNYPTASPSPSSQRVWWLPASAKTNEKAQNDRLISDSSIGGWDSDAQVAWKGYWDENGWNVLYLEDKKSLSLKYDFAKSKKLAGVGIWALGYDADSELWSLLFEKFGKKYLSLDLSTTRNF